MLVRKQLFIMPAYVPMLSPTIMLKIIVCQCNSPRPTFPPLWQCFSDIPHKLCNYLSEEGLLDIVITDAKKEPNVYKKIKEYEFGVAQPGVLCIKPDRAVLYQWRIIPAEVKATLLKSVKCLSILRRECQK